MGKQTSPDDLSDCWVCEGCGEVTQGVNPPDVCVMCDHAYHESMADILASAPPRSMRH